LEILDVSKLEIERMFRFIDLCAECKQEEVL